MGVHTTRGNAIVLKISKAALVAAVLSLSAVPATGIVAPAFAQDVVTSDSGFNIALSIPTIQLVDSTMNEGAIRETLSGKFLEHADDLASLNATSITIPEISLTTTTTMGETTQSSTTVYKDLVLTDVEDGVVKSFSVGSAEAKSPQGTFAYGKSEYTDVDMGGILEFIGILPGDPTQDLAPAFTSSTSEGGSFKNDNVDCTFNKWGGPGFNVRPSAVSLASVIDAVQKMQGEKSNPPPEALKTLVGYVTGILENVQSEPSSFEGLDCTGTDDKGKQFTVGLDSIDIGGFDSAIYPGVAINGLKVSADDGSISLDNLTLKSTDLSQPIALLKSDDVQWTDAWFQQNARRLIPAFGGLSLSGLAIDVPDPQAPGSRIAANIANFDLTLSDYINGIPSKITSTASGVDVPLPKDSTDESVKMLQALGITQVNMGYDLDIAWDEASNTINLSKFSVTGEDLGGFAVAAMIGSAPKELFDIDPNTAMAAAMSVTLQGLSFDLKDDGLGDKLVPMLAAQQGADPATFRDTMAKTSEAAAIQMLGSNDAARSLGAAISSFISGTAKALNITITPKDPNGVALPQLMQASNDPTALLSVVDITGKAE